jgi:hypothetical protein
MWELTDELNRLRTSYEQLEKDVCKNCEDRLGIPCLVAPRCEKLKGLKADEQ